jgi:VanZ family protein
MRKHWLSYFVTHYFPAFLWMAVIFYLSSFHNLRTGSEFVVVEIIIRKLAHAAEFAILAYLIFRILEEVHIMDEKKAFWWSLALVALYAVSDEFHQMFVSGREARIFDVLIDVIGSYIGLYIIIGAKRKVHSKKLFILMLVIFISLIVYKTWDSIQTYGLYIEKNDSVNGTVPIPSLPETEDAVVGKEENNAEISPDSGSSISEVQEREIPEANQPLPDRVLITVPFTTQAPFANWDARHEEACEEASLIMVKYFLDGKKLDKDVAEKEIQDIMDFEIKKYGDDTDSTVAEIVRLAKDYYKIDNLKVIYDFSKEDLKEQLSLRKPIIVPAAGRLLSNPNFTPPGPLYHNLVLIGYDGNIIITNDPGTRKGQNYTYPIGTLYSAIHDFPGDKNKINQGRKAMIVIE